MVVKLVFLLLSIISISQAEFTIPITFDDSSFKRPLIVDITSNESFVLDAKIYRKLYGAENTFDPSGSRTFKNLGSFSKSFAEEFNRNSSYVQGVFGSDRTKYNGNDVIGSFGVATTVTGRYLPFELSDGRPAAGRIGLAWGDDKTTLGNALITGLNKRILCLRRAKGRRPGETLDTIHLGSVVYRPDELITKARALPQEAGTWTIEKTLIKIRGSHDIRNLETTFTTTYDGIALPSSFYAIVKSTLKAKLDTRKNAYLVPCAESTPLILTIDGKRVDIPFDAYTKNLGRGVCELKLKDSKSSKSLVLGLPLFLGSGACFDYDGNEVHFFRL